MKREEILETIKEVLKRYGIKKARLFGSFARGEPFNDIDILIDPPKGFGFFDLCKMADEMEERLKVKVDIVTVGGLSKYIKPYVEKEAVPI